MATRLVAAEQPHITRLTHFAQIAAEKKRGFEYVANVSALLYNPEVSGWDQGDHLAAAMSAAGLDLQEFETIAANDAARLEACVLANRESQLAAGHWGAPLFAFEGEIFFGQDRLDDLLWHLRKNGLVER